jgi:hypothetical protein
VTVAGAAPQLREELAAIKARILDHQRRLTESSSLGHPTAQLTADLAQLIVARAYIEDKLDRLSSAQQARLKETVDKLSATKGAAGAVGKAM